MNHEDFEERIRAVAAEAMVRRSTYDEAVLVNALCVTEEAGEAAKEIRRHMGFGRGVSPITSVAEELADVIISAWVTAEMLNIDLWWAVERKLEHIKDRGGL